MKLPSEAPVMTLPGATLFPQALLPLYIFEPRYRKMLSDTLRAERMFSVAMQQPGCSRETPCTIAGLGLIRVSVGHKDGTSHLILQGLTRVELGDTVQRKPYRIQSIRPIDTPILNNVKLDALLAKVFELVRHRVELGGFPPPFPLLEPTHAKPEAEPGPMHPVSAERVIRYLENLPGPAAAADLVACALLTSPSDRQAILETVPLEQRLFRLIDFLMAEIRDHRKNENQ